MKSIVVPYIPDLNGSTAELAANFLEEVGEEGNIGCVNWATLFPYKPITFFWIGRSQSHLFIKYFVNGNVLRAIYTHDQESVWKDSCVEFFCQLPGHQEYTNFEFNCIGTCYSAVNKKPRDGKLRPVSEMQQIDRYPSMERKAFNEMEGDFKWELTVAIPFALMGIDSNHLPDKIMGNFYKCGDDTSMKHYVSWNPILTETPDFHRPDFFGELLFK
jgi:hypothetical protein